MTDSPHPHTPLLERATELGLTLAVLAEHFHTTPETVAAWLIGTVPIPGENRADLAGVLELADLDDVEAPHGVADDSTRA